MNLNLRYWPLKEHFDLDLGTRSEVVCEFSSLNKECKGKDCPFQKGHGTGAE